VTVTEQRNDAGAQLALLDWKGATRNECTQITEADGNVGLLRRDGRQGLPDERAALHGEHRVSVQPRTPGDGGLGARPEARLQAPGPLPVVPEDRTRSLRGSEGEDRSLEEGACGAPESSLGGETGSEEGRARGEPETEEATIEEAIRAAIGIATAVPLLRTLSIGVRSMTQDIAAPASEEPAELVRLRAECDRLAGCLDVLCHRPNSDRQGSQ